MTDYFYGYLDFEPDTDDDIPDKHILTIGTWERNDFDGTFSFTHEVATIVHRTNNGIYPLDGHSADQKRRQAQEIVDLLNAKHLTVKSN